MKAVKIIQNNALTKTRLLAIAAITALSTVLLLLTSSAGAATYTVNEGESIQAAIDGAVDGDIIEVAPGAYTEHVVVNKSVILRGAKAGQDARDRAATGETVLQADSGAAEVVRITAPNVTIDGFTVTAAAGADTTDAIRLVNPATDATVVNSALRDGRHGVHGNGADASGLRVYHNLFESNNRANGSHGVFVRDGGDDIEIADNAFRNHYNELTGGNSAVQVAGSTAAPVTNIRILRNTSTQDGSFFMTYGASNVQVIGNKSDNQQGSGIYVGASVTGITISDNTITNGPRGIIFATDFPNTNRVPSTDVTISENTITGMTEAGIIMREDAVDGEVTVVQNRIFGNAVGIQNESTAAVIANDNWWGCTGGPGQPGCDTIAGEGVQVDSWLSSDPAASDDEGDGQQRTEDGQIIPGVPNTGRR